MAVSLLELGIMDASRTGRGWGASAWMPWIEVVGVG